MYKMRTTTQQTEAWFTLHCATPSAAVQHVFRPRLPLTVVSSCILCTHWWHYETKFISYGIAIAICSSQLGFFCLQEKNKTKQTKAFNVCMYSMLSWHWIKRIKQENSRIKLSLKTEKLAVSNPSDWKSWCYVRDTRKRWKRRRE